MSSFYSWYCGRTVQFWRSRLWRLLFIMRYSASSRPVFSRFIRKHFQIMWKIFILEHEKRNWPKELTTYIMNWTNDSVSKKCLQSALSERNACEIDFIFPPIGLKFCSTISIEHIKTLCPAKSLCSCKFCLFSFKRISSLIVLYRLWLNVAGLWWARRKNAQ